MENKQLSHETDQYIAVNAFEMIKVLGFQIHQKIPEK